MGSKELAVLTALLLGATACTEAKAGNPTPTRTPFSSPSPTLRPPTETIFPTAFLDLATATVIARATTTATLLPPTEAIIEKSAFVTGDIDFRQNYTVVPPVGLNLQNIEVIALSQQSSLGWDNELNATFVNLELPESRRSCMALKTDLPGILKLDCHSFKWAGKPLPFDWLRVMGTEKIIGEQMTIIHEEVSQTYEAIAAVEVDEKKADAQQNPEGFRPQIGGIYAHTEKLGIPQKIRDLIRGQEVIIMQVCSGMYYKDSKGHNAFTKRMFVFWQRVVE